MRRTGADQAGSELIEIGFTDHQRTDGAQIGDDGCICRRLIGKLRAGGGSRPAADIDIVFDRKRHTKQRQAADVPGDGFKPLGQLLVLPLQLFSAGKIQPGIVIRWQIGQQGNQRGTHAGHALAGRVGMIMMLPFAEGETA
ncbi:hypothetical protein D3C81_574360 [compost metagenome]